MTTNLRINNLAWLLIIALSILWGLTFFAAKIALQELPPVTLTFLRVAIAALALHLLLPVLGLRFPFNSRLLAAFLGMGILNNVIPFNLIFWGQTQIGAGLASVLNGMTPIFTVIVAHIFTHDEKATPQKIFGVIAGFAGVATMIGMEALSGLSLNILAQLAVVLATVSYAFSGVYGRRLRETPPLISATGQLTASTLFMLPIMLIVDQPWSLTMPGSSTWLAVLAVAILGSAIAYILFYRILAIAGATNLMLVTFLIPVTAVLLGYLYLGEVLQPRHWAGIALIAVGLAAIDGRLLSAFRRREATGSN